METFWTFYSNWQPGQPIDTDKLDKLHIELCSSIEAAITRDGKTGFVFLRRNLQTLFYEANRVDFERQSNPANGELASLQSALRSLANSLFLMGADYFPEQFNDPEMEALAEKHCSVQIFQALYPGPETQENQSEPAREKQSFREIALAYVWNGYESITRENCKQIAKENGHEISSKAGALKLYNEYTFWAQSRNRTALPNSESRRAIRAKLVLFDKVINSGLLTEDGTRRALNELERFENVADTYLV